MHVSLETPAAFRPLLRVAFAYPFENLGLRVLTGNTPANCVRALQLSKHLGFTETHRTSDGWAPGVDMVHTELRREDCRWIRRFERHAA